MIDHNEARCPTWAFYEVIIDCPVKKGSGHYYLRYDEREMRWAKRRQQENTAEFKDR